MFVGHQCYVCYLYNWHAEYKYHKNINLNFKRSTGSEKASKFQVTVKKGTRELSQIQYTADNIPKPKDAQVWASVTREILIDHNSVYS